MAKKRKRISPSQRDKGAIEAAKLAKKRGLLSKQTKLHSGKYISARVLKRVRELAPQLASGYVGIKVPRKQYVAAKEAGYLVSNGRIIGPSKATPEGRVFQKRIAKGDLAGVKPLAQGHMESVIIPYDVMDVIQFTKDAIADPSKMDQLKMSDELFAFKFYGSESYEVFLGIRDLAKYFFKYRSIQDAASEERVDTLEDMLENFQVFRITPYNVRQHIRPPEQRKADKKANRQNLPDGRRAKAWGDLTDDQKAYRSKKKRIQGKRFRAALEKDSAKKAEYLAKARVRMANRRGKKDGN